MVPIPAPRPEASNTVGSWLGVVLEGMTPWGISSSTAGVFSWKFNDSFFDTTLQALTSLFLAGVNLTMSLLDHNLKQPHCLSKGEGFKFQLSQGSL